MSIRLAAIGFQHQHVFDMLYRLLARPGVALVALAEDDPDLRARAVARYSVAAYADYRELLAREGPQAAVLAPVNRTKPEVIAACAAAGVHIYVDKPMATTLEGLDQIAEAIRTHRTVLAMSVAGGYGSSVAWKRLIDQGALGTLVQFVDLAPHRLHLRPTSGWTRPAWSYERTENGGIIVDVAVHGINTWRYLSGQEVAEISAVQGNKRFPEHPNLEDYGSVFLTMTDGATAFLAPTWLTPDADPSHGRGATYVVGTQGQLEITSPGIAHGLEPRQEREEVVLTTADRPPHRPELASDGLPSQEEDFVRAVETGRSLALGADFVIESQRIALLARDAADRRRTIRVR
jgi:predicted dehydrogenase